MLRAVADIGSNTVKYGIYELDGKISLPKRIFFDSRTMKLVSHIKNGVFDESALDELVSVLCDYRRSAESKGAVSFDIFATAWIRQVNNANEICRRIEAETGYRVEILSGETEARLSQCAMVHELPGISDGICVDMGGGSTEIIRFNSAGIIDSRSMRFGCVVLKERFVSSLFPCESEAENINGYVEDELRQLTFDIKSDTLCLVGGSAKALEKLCKTVYGCEVSTEALEQLYIKMSASKEEAELILINNVPERADTAIPALIGFITICRKVNPVKIKIVTSGTREGYLIDKYHIGEKK